MKKILITGVNSYIGTKLYNWLMQKEESYSINMLSLRDSNWIQKDFSDYDVIVHVAGIAHVSSDPKNKDKYYRINRDLTIGVAKKAKKDGVTQFIFLSSIIVYGDSSNKNGIITHDTIPNPKDFYGDSKLQAEKGINVLDDESFKISIIRPPMIYGKDSRGNYPRLSKLASYVLLFPDFDNKRSMLHIDNLNKFIENLIVHKESGLFFPQNEEYVKTSNLVKEIAEVHNRRILFTKLLNPIIKVLRNRIGLINKVFGDLIYSKDMSQSEYNYQINNLKTSIQLTEGGSKNC